MAKYNKDGTLSEYSVQKAVVDWLRLHPDILFFSIPNEVASNPIKGRQLKLTGLHKGASDLFISVPRHHFHGMYLELKSTKGILRDEQRLFFRKAEKHGYFTAACWSIDEALEILQWYCFGK